MVDVARAPGWLLPATASPLEFLADLVEQVPHPIFVKDRQFRYVLVNSALVRIAGHPMERILGKTDYDFLPEKTADFYRAKDIEVFSTAAEVIVDQEVLTDGGGERRVLSTRKVPLRGAGEEVTHIIGIISDITRLKDIQEDLRLSTEQLEQRVAERTRALALAQEDLVRKERLAVLGRLAGGVAHQIRNPLGAIKNAAYILDRRLRDHEASLAAPTEGAEKNDIVQAIAIIHDEVQRANQIITDLLDYARIRVPVRRLTSVASLVEQAFEAQSVPPTVTVVRRMPELPSIAVDGDQLQGALFNLLRNAIEAMPEGGTLAIDAELRDATVVVRIGDSGTGIPEEVRGRLFEPLVTTKPLGLGLGLVTARTLVEGQGGTIACVGSDEHGTSFEITLPIAPAA
ncbi:MAG: sensor histidine kinase [Myxococcaceae bacterium]|nr:sensor histidine kinase [Myxococcaceae bacterium]